ncbi:unnamed protein product [Rotaria sp. Silwood2]|nr:unnamed protein product [Rotaria sp. Silwood2]
MTMVVADWGNHRIVQWKIGEKNGEIVAGGNGPGNHLNQLNCPTDVLIDKETNSLMICDRGNRRVLKWSRQQGTTQGEKVLENIACWGLAMDDQKCLYVSDIEKHEVRRYEIGDKNGTVVAGNNGRGVSRKQLNAPSYIFVDLQKNIYVSDTLNHRVVKWNRGASEGIIVMHGFFRGLLVDRLENIYVADYGNHRVMRWPKDAIEGTVIADGNETEGEGKKLYHPWSLSFGQDGYLYIAEHARDRIQRIPIE